MSPSFITIRSGAVREEEARLNVRYVPLETLLETADVVSLHVPLNDATRDL